MDGAAFECEEFQTKQWEESGPWWRWNKELPGWKAHMWKSALTAVAFNIYIYICLKYVTICLSNKPLQGWRKEKNDLSTNSCDQGYSWISKKLSGIFIVLHQSLELWWNLKSTTETVTPDRESGVIKAELMSRELAHQGAHQGRKLCQ